MSSPTLCLCGHKRSYHDTVTDPIGWPCDVVDCPCESFDEDTDGD